MSGALSLHPLGKNSKSKTVQQRVSVNKRKTLTSLKRARPYNFTVIFQRTRLLVLSPSGMVNLGFPSKARTEQGALGMSAPWAPRIHGCRSYSRLVPRSLLTWDLLLVTFQLGKPPAHKPLLPALPVVQAGGNGGGSGSHHAGSSVILRIPASVLQNE